MLTRLLIYGAFLFSITFPLLVILLDRIGLSSFLSALKDLVTIASVFLILLYAVKNKIRSITPFALIMLVFCLYIFPRFISYVGIVEGLNGLRYYLLYPLLCFSLLLLPRDFKDYLDIKKYSILMYFFGFIYITLGFIEYFDDSIIESIRGIPKYEMKHTELAAGTRLLSIFSNPINFGIFICFTASSIFFIHLEKGGKGSHWFLFWIVISVAIWCGFFTLSRTVFIVLLLELLIFYFILIKRNNFTSWLVFTGLLFILIYQMPLILSSLDDKLIDRFAGLLSNETYASNTRVHHWIEALEKIDNPLYYLMGLGLGTSNPSSDSLGFTIENSFLTIFLDLGFIGLSLFLIILIYSIVKLYKIENTNIRIFLFVNLFVFCISSLANDVIRNYPFSFMFWMTIFFIHNYSEKENMERKSYEN